MMKEKLTEEERQKGMKYAVYEGASASAMSAISGSFLVLFALALGANNFMIGLVVSIPAILATFSYLPAAYFVERYGNVRRICMIFSFIGRVMWIFIALVPFIFTGNVIWLIIFAAINSLAASFTGNAWAIMMGDIVPQEIRGEYFGRRNKICAVASLIITILCGVVLEVVKGIMGFVLLFFMAGIFGVVTSYFFSRFPEIKYEPKKGNIVKDLHDIRLDSFFLPFLIIIFIWQFAYNFYSPFVNVYIIKGLGASYIWVSFLIVVSGIATILVQRQWGTASDIFGHGSILKITAFATGLIPLFWFFIPNVWYGIWIEIILGIAFAGFNLAAFNYLLQVSPRGKRGIYCSFYWTITAAASIIAPAAAGSFADMPGTGMFSGIRLVLYMAFGIHLFASVLFLKYLKELPYKEMSTQQITAELIRMGSASMIASFHSLEEKEYEIRKKGIRNVENILYKIKKLLMNLVRERLKIKKEETK